jgi:hypothetical protein
LRPVTLQDRHIELSRLCDQGLVFSPPETAQTDITSAHRLSDARTKITRSTMWAVSAACGRITRAANSYAIDIGRCIEDFYKPYPTSRKDLAEIRRREATAQTSQPGVLQATTIGGGDSERALMLENDDFDGKGKVLSVAMNKELLPVSRAPDDQSLFRWCKPPSIDKSESEREREAGTPPGSDLTEKPE